MKKLPVIFSCILILCTLSTASLAAEKRLSLQQIGQKSFGTDEYQTHEVLSSAGISSFLGSSSEEYALVSAIQKALKSNGKLIIYGSSSSTTADVIQRTFERYIPMTFSPKSLSKLQLLFIGKAEDAKKIKATVGKSGAKFLAYSPVS